MSSTIGSIRPDTTLASWSLGKLIQVLYICICLILVLGVMIYWSYTRHTDDILSGVLGRLCKTLVKMMAFRC